MSKAMCARVRWTAGLIGVLGWLSLGALTVWFWAEPRPVVVLAATLAASGTLGWLLAALPLTPRAVWEMAYDCGWRDGRRAERLTRQQGMPASKGGGGVVTRLPLPTQLDSMSSPMDRPARR